MPSRRAATAVALSLGLAACDASPPPGVADDGPAAAVPGGGTAPATSLPPGSAPTDLRFEEVALKAGLDFHNTFLRPEQGEDFKINLYDHGSGVAVADIDGDGLEDVYLLNQLGPNGMFRNLGNGTFENVTATSGTGLDTLVCVAAVFADADGDGDPDLYVTTTRAGNVYMENDGKGVFRDATRKAGLLLMAESMSPCFFDADGDGDLDLFVSNTARWTEDTYDDRLNYYRGKGSLDGLIRSEKLPNVFYRNDGKGVFTDATKEAGLEGKGWGGDIAAFDYDGDGDLDLYVCNMFGASTLYRNDAGRFTEVTAEVLGRTSWGAVGTRAFDYDNDGRQDLFTADMHSDMWMPFDMPASMVEEKVRYRTFFERQVKEGWAPAKSDDDFILQASIPMDRVVFGNTLHRNLGGGKFEEVSARAGWETFWPWGVVEGDFDGDGYLDVFVPAGMGYPLFHWRNSLLRNTGKGTFEDVGRTAGLEPPPGGAEMEVSFRGKKAVRSSRSAATLDFDGDGRLDLIVNNFNDRCWLWRNISPARPWVRIRLQETRGHRDAIGAEVRLTAGGVTRTRMVQAAGGYLSQSSNILHFGLPGDGVIEKVEVRWPGGNRQVVKDLKAGALHTVVEPAVEPGE